MASNKIGLHWFRHDLRTLDNQALRKLSEHTDSQIGIFVFEDAWFEENEWGFKHLGSKRLAFIESALRDLRERMQSMGSDLIIAKGNAVETINSLCQKNEITHISVEMHAGFNERKQLKSLQNGFNPAADSSAEDRLNAGESGHSKAQTPVQFIIENSNYLYSVSDFPFSLENMPDTFSPFRRKVEKYAEPRQSEGDLNNSNGKGKADFALNLAKLDTSGIPDFELSSHEELGKYAGGESAALARLDEYFFESDGIAEYKETRNGLDGWEFSSRFSAFLAHGCISPSYINDRLKQYEREKVKNDSTYWLFFELLWREFFHWQHIKHGAKLFSFAGIQNKTPDTSLNSEAFKSWREGDTGYDIVDACMKQLNESGFMSNRGRQLVASCFVHELGLDWRYGAAYFEQQLIDFDVASNWGNWQYLAGVGSDPRGHRQFNLQKQTDTYDPKRVFINKWLHQ
uniref:DASH family cryptochrome n=1 Tax=Ningiella ruwaisensis TaxID=2364274 RepID=UPI00109F4074|nr:DASH family cryptochrome [Ningiella ruwaisensis]